MYRMLCAEDGSYVRTLLTNDEDERTLSWSNCLHDERYRKFSIIINKHDGQCTLIVENIRDEVLNQQGFHVSPFRGRWGEEENSPFVANDDAWTIAPAMAYAFKPMLLNMGMMMVQGDFFSGIRKSCNAANNFLSINKNI